MTVKELGANIRPVQVENTSENPVQVEIVGTAGDESFVTSKPFKISEYTQQSTIAGGVNDWISDGLIGTYKLFEGGLLTPNEGFEAAEHFQTLIVNISVFNETGAQLNGYKLSTQIFIRHRNTTQGTEWYSPVTNIAPLTFNAIPDGDANTYVALYTNQADVLPNQIDMQQQAALLPFSTSKFPIMTQGNYKEVEVRHAGIMGFVDGFEANGDTVEISTIMYIGYEPTQGGSDFPLLDINFISASTI